MLIAISGAIGAGKSTVTRIFSQITGFEPLFETVEGHPYLERFYQNPREYAFRTQVFFLWDRFQKHYAAVESGKDLVADRSIYEDCIFARVLHRRGEMDDDDFLRTYLPHYRILSRLLRPPELMIYLRASLDTLIYRIRKRARDMEKDIDQDYLAMLLDAYEEWIEEYPHKKLIIDTNHLDLTCDLNADWDYVVQAIKTKITYDNLPDIAAKISHLLCKLPWVHNHIEPEMVKTELFG